MLNINKQIEYWKNTAVNDIETAEILISNKRFVEGLFFCHLCIEKIIKAHVVKTTQELAPKSHKLAYLTELSKITITNEHKILMALLMKYQIEGRYPDYYPEPPSNKAAKDYLHKTKELLECLKQML